MISELRRTLNHSRGPGLPRKLTLLRWKGKEETNIGSSGFRLSGDSKTLFRNGIANWQSLGTSQDSRRRAKGNQFIFLFKSSENSKSALRIRCLANSHLAIYLTTAFQLISLSRFWSGSDWSACAIQQAACTAVAHSGNEVVHCSDNACWKGLCEWATLFRLDLWVWRRE
jgi:hypothetical protein